MFFNSDFSPYFFSLTVLLPGDITGNAQDPLEGIVPAPYQPGIDTHPEKSAVTAALLGLKNKRCQCLWIFSAPLIHFF